MTSWAIYDAHTRELLDGGFSTRDAAEVYAEREYRSEGARVYVARQRD